MAATESAKNNRGNLPPFLGAPEVRKVDRTYKTMQAGEKAMKTNITLSEKELATLDRAAVIITEYNRLSKHINNGDISKNNEVLESLIDDFIAGIKTAQNIAS